MWSRVFVLPEHRGAGLGKRLLVEALRFCAATRYDRVFLWTVDELPAAARLYRAAGFQLVEETKRVQWGSTVTEQRYQQLLDRNG